MSTVTTKQMLMEEEGEFFLPHDIMFNVLKRIPVKSLIRFQCVCKGWSDLLKTSSFIKEHLHHTNHHRGPSLLLQWGYSNFHMLDSDKETLMRLNAHWINNHPLFPFRLIGSINGLFCLQDSLNDFLFLKNPATREVQQVPKTNKNNLWYIAFGFSRVTDDYKIVTFYDFRHAEVYSVSTGSWKKVGLSDDNLLKGVRFLGSFVATDEAIYWLAYNSQIRILSFDTATDVFTVIPMPDTPHIHQNIKLIEYENKLALLSGIELWVMEEATSGGSGQTWTKVIRSPHLQRLHLMTIWRNEAVFMFELGICLFNLTTKKIKKIIVTSEYGKKFLLACEFGIISAFNYVDSLVTIGNKNSRTSS